MPDFENIKGSGSNEILKSFEDKYEDLLIDIDNNRENGISKSNFYSIIGKLQLEDDPQNLQELHQELLSSFDKEIYDGLDNENKKRVDECFDVINEKLRKAA